MLWFAWLLSVIMELWLLRIKRLILSFVFIVLGFKKSLLIQILKHYWDFKCYLKNWGEIQSTWSGTEALGKGRSSQSQNRAFLVYMWPGVGWKTLLESAVDFLPVQPSVALLCSCLPLVVRNHLNGDDFCIFVLNQSDSFFNGLASRLELNQR